MAELAKPLTIDEAAEYFRCKRRFFSGELVKLCAAFPDRDLYEQFGRRKLFYPEHLARIRAARRELAKMGEPPRSRPSKAKTGTCGELSEANQLTRVRELAFGKSPTDSATPKKRGSSSVISLEESRRPPPFKDRPLEWRP